VRGSARDLKGWLVQLGLVRPLAAAVRPVGRRAAKITVSPHRTVAVIAVEPALRCVDRNVVVVDTEAVALRIMIGEQAPGASCWAADTRHDVGGRERCPKEKLWSLAIP
jgi:hypothetical protein